MLDTKEQYPTVVVFGREEPEERRDALAVLRVVEVVAPPVDRPVLVGVVAGQGVLVARAGVQRDGADHAGDVDVAEAVGEVVEVDVDAVGGHLALDAGVAGSGERFFIFFFTWISTLECTSGIGGLIGLRL